MLTAKSKTRFNPFQVVNIALVQTAKYDTVVFCFVKVGDSCI